jgi:hypothetical protein
LGSPKKDTHGKEMTMTFKEYDREMLEELFEANDEDITYHLGEVLISYPDYIEDGWVNEIFTVDDADVIADNTHSYVEEMNYIDRYKLRARIKSDFISQFIDK